MIVDKDLIKEAKEKLGDKAAFIIAMELDLKEFDERNLKAICKWHEEDTPSLIWNPKDNAYKCFGCGKVYGIIDHYMAYDHLTFLGATQKLFNKVGIKYAFGTIGVKERAYHYPEYKEDNNRALVENYLSDRGISQGTLDYFNVKQYKGSITFNFYDENDVLTTVKLRPSRAIKKGEPKMWFLPNYDNKPILYGMNKIDPTKPLCICEGEIESLSAYEAGYSNVVSVPAGTENKKWIEQCWDWLEQFDKIILAYDNDEPGIKARKDVASRLGIWRTQYVIFNDNLVNQDTGRPCKDLNEVLCNYGKETLMSLIINAQDIPVEGVSNLSEVGVFDIEKAEGLYPRLKPLDDIVYKFLMGSVIVFTGKRGCVDADTEYFDGNGWKRIADYALGDKVLQFNKDETAELVMPLEYHKYPESKMWHFRTKYGIDQVVSDEHEIVYWTSKNNLYKKSAKEIVGWYKDKDKGYKYHFSYSGSIPTVFEYSGDGLPYDDITLRLFVASICDGSYYYNVSEDASTYTKCRFHIKKEHKKERLRKLFAESPYEHNEAESASDGYTDFYITLPLRVKEFEGWWYSASNAQLKLIVEEALLWDGSIGKKSPSFSSSVKANIDFIQFAAHATGHTATIYTNDRRGTKRKDSRYTYKSLEYSVTITNRRKLYLGYEKSLIKEHVPKDGYKYCFTVPSGMLVLRRNGRVFVTGNSGKSSFINQAFVNEGLNQGYDIFYYSGELDSRVLKSWLDVNLAGEENIRSEQDGFVRIINNESLQDINKWYDGRVWIYDNHSHKAKDIIDVAQATTRRYGAKIWIIDNLMMLDLESEGDMSSVLQKQKEFIANLVRLAQLYNVLVVLAIHPRKGMAGQNELSADDVSGSGDLTNMSQYVISAHRYTDREKEGEMNNRGEYKKGKEPIEHDVCIEVLKNRFTGKNGRADLFFNYTDYRFYSNEDELYRRYKWNTSTKPVKRKKKENEASAFFLE